MKVSFALSADMVGMLTSLQNAAKNAGVPPLPAVSNLIDADLTGNVLMGEPIKIVIGPAQGLKDWCTAIEQRLSAFSDAKEDANGSKA